jgi:hypothetical protein
MTLLYHNNLLTVVNKISPEELVVQSTLLASGWEATASIRASTATFAIVDARWDICRSPGGKQNGGRVVPALLGVEACLGSGPALRAAAAGEGELPYSLLVECVKGIIQAETYLFRERGYPDAATFEKSWKDNYTGSCRLYSGDGHTSRSWYEHIADRAWSDLLFTRAKTAAVTAAGDGTIAIAGSFIDSFHEIGASLAVRGGAVTAATGGFLRAPGDVCPESVAALASMVGTPLAALDRKGITGYLGGPRGCVHLADLVTHMLHTLQSYGRG